MTFGRTPCTKISIVKCGCFPEPVYLFTCPLYLNPPDHHPSQSNMADALVLPERNNKEARLPIPLALKPASGECVTSSSIGLASPLCIISCQTRWIAPNLRRGAKAINTTASLICSEPFISAGKSM